jgi:hypothetical protein
MQTPDTPAQKEAREEYIAACIALSKATHDLIEAKAAHEREFKRYAEAFGAARQAGVLK